MEITTNQESVIDVEENHETNSIVALWNFIAPKIDVARNILFSAITDLVDKSKLEENKSRKESLNSMHWKNNKKSIWTLSTTTGRRDDLSFSTDEGATSLHKSDSKYQKTQNLDDEVHFKRNNAVCLRLSREEKSSDIAKFFLHEKNKQAEVSTMGLFRQDSIGSKKSYYSVERKKNLVIKCDYSTIPPSKNILQVYENQQSMLSRRSPNSSEVQSFDGENSSSYERKSVLRDSAPSLGKSKKMKRRYSKNQTESRKSGNSSRRRKSIHPRASLTSSNRYRCSEETREGRSQRMLSQSSADDRFSRMLSNLCSRGLQISSISHGKNIREQKSYPVSKPLVNHRCCDSPVGSAHDFRNSLESHASKIHSLPYITSFDIPPHIPLSYNNISCAPTHFVPHLILPRSKHRAKKLNIKKSCKSTQYIPLTQSNCELNPKSGRSGKFINSFCSLKARILASASSPRSEIPDTPTVPSQQYELQRDGAQTNFNLNHGAENSRNSIRSIFSRLKKRRNLSKRGYASPTSCSEIPTTVYSTSPRPSRVVMCGTKASERRMFGLRQRPVVEEKLKSSNSDISFPKNPLILLSNGDIFHIKRKKNRPRWMPKHKFSSSSLRYSMRPAKRNYSDDYPVQHHYHRKNVYPPHDSTCSTDNDYRYSKYFYPYQLVEYPNISEENMYYCPSYMFPYPSDPLSSPDVPPMFKLNSSCRPRTHSPRPVLCSPPRRPPIPPHHLAQRHQISHPYITHPYSQPYSSGIGSYPYHVNSYTPCSTRTSISSVSSSHLEPDVRNSRAPYWKHRAQSLLRLHENLRYARGHRKRFEYKRLLGRDKHKGFSKSRCFSIPAYPMRSCGPDTFLGMAPRVSDERKDKESRYSGYPFTQRPAASIHPANCLPYVSGDSRESLHPFYLYHPQKNYQMDELNRSFHRKQISKQTSCNSLIFNQHLLKRKDTVSRKIGNTSSSIYSVTSSHSSKYRSGSSTRSTSDGNVSKASANFFVSKNNLLDDNQKYQHLSSCTSSKTPSDYTIDYKNNRYRNKRLSLFKSATCKPYIFGARTYETSFYGGPVLDPTVPYRNMIGLRSQVCSSATDVHCNLKFKYAKIKHFDDRIRFELQKIGFNQLIDASKPAKCCKQTILNQPSIENLPYAASLASLPLDEKDIQVIKQSVKMASKKKDFNYESLENRRKLMYYANILTDKYDMKKPKVEPKYEIRYIYYKLDDIKKVQNIINKKYNKKNKYKFLQILSSFFERSIYTSKLFANQTNLINYFDSQICFKLGSSEKLCCSNRKVGVFYEESRQFKFLGKYLMLKIGIYSEKSENSLLINAVCTDIDDWRNLIFKCIKVPLNSEKRSIGNSCTKFEEINYQEYLDEWKKKFKLCNTSRTGSENDITNSEIAYRSFSNKKTILFTCISDIFLFKDGFVFYNESHKAKYILNSDEMNFNTNEEDINILNLFIKPEMKNSIMAKYHMIIVYFVNYFISRVCAKTIHQHSDYPEQIIFSTPSIQLQAKIYLFGMSAILKIYLSIPDTIVDVINFAVSIDELKNNSSLLTSREKFPENIKSINREIQFHNKKHTDLYSTNEDIAAYIKLTNHKQVIHLCRTANITNSFSRFRQDLDKKNLNFPLYDAKKTTTSEKETIFSMNSKKIISKSLYNSSTESETQRAISTFKLFYIIQKKELITEISSYQGNITKIILDSQKKLVLGRNNSDMQLIHLLENHKFEYGRIYIIDVVINYRPVFPPFGNILANVPTFSKNVQTFTKSFIDSQKYFMQLIWSHKENNMSAMYDADVESMIKKCRPILLMESGVNLNNCMEVAPYLSEKCKLFETIFFYLINECRIKVLSGITTGNRLRIENTQLSKYTLPSADTTYAQLNCKKTKSFKYKGYNVSFKMKPGHLPVAEAEIQKKYSEPAANISILNRAVELYIYKRRRNAKYPYNQLRSKKMDKKQKKKFPAEDCESSFYHSVLKFPSSSNTSVSEEYQIDSNKESRTSTGKLEIRDDQTCNYGKQTSKRCQQKLPSKETKVTTILPCCGTSGSIIQRSGDSLESLLDDCLENGKFMKHEEMESRPKSKEASSKDDRISTQVDEENSKSTLNSSFSVSDIEANISSKDAFLCNLPNAPPFILKMNKTSFETEAMSEKEGKTLKTDCNEPSSMPTSIIDSLEVGRVSHIYSTLCHNNKRPGYSEVSKHNLFIDNTCPAISNQEFRRFLGKSISIIKNNKDILINKSRGCFMSSPTICMTGLSGFSINPFTMDERDSKRLCQNIACRPSADILSNQTTHHYHSKIPRMLHPGKYKVHTKMRNVQLSPGTKGHSGKSQACSSKACHDYCPTERMDNRMNQNNKISPTTTCPTGTNTCASANSRSEKRPSVVKNIPPQTPVTQAPMGDCVKGIKSDPGCYCGSPQNDPIPCPVRLKETFEYDEEDTAKEEDEDNEDTCYCPPGEQPLLLKKSNIECDCANRNRCENETLVDPPVEKPNVFWALTKVSLLKDGTKNFEIIDVSPLPPGYYLMPEVNHLILVGPQPKPVKAPPNKNCSCK